MTAYSERLDRALVLAAAVHDVQLRKGTAVPYIIHPYHVALILDRHGWPEDVVVAGALHDVLEDAKCEEPEFRERVRAVCPDLASAPEDEAGFRCALGDHIQRVFGEGVLAIVRHVTEEKKERSGERRPWKTRKLEQLESMKRASREVAALKAADLLHNGRAIARDVRAAGPSVMARFNAPPAEVLWYYRSALDLVVGRLGEENPLARELQGVVVEFEAAFTTWP
ncbi:MAG: HD domain-containing protein [Acidobacteria bacterium]|nr:HD domain-containing protein [Acidobacteriota bacterium]